jgi:hypothetical protein
MVAVLLGVTILGERLGLGSAAGLLLILAGSWLSTDGRLPRLRRVIAEPAPVRPVPQEGCRSHA